MIDWDRKLIGEGLSFDDILLIPAESAVLPKEAEVRTQLNAEIAALKAAGLQASA